ncbi:MAG: hypothetical protein LBL73_07550, partial [Synergistaceae bacterium]|nr:hypothetical protein [Synergistaceae bacterium]
MGSDLKDGVQVERSGKKAAGYSKRVIALFILCVALLLIGITVQAKFKTGGNVRENPAKNYRIPQPSGFAELASSMRRDRKTAAPQPVSQDRHEPGTRKIIIEGTKKESKESVIRPVITLPRYYSNKDDAQAASQLRTLKMQALSAKPVVDDFQPEKMDRNNAPVQGNNNTNVMRSNTAPQIMDSSAMAARGREQNPDPNGQAGKQDFLRGTNGGGSLTPQGYSASLPVPQQFP